MTESKKIKKIFEIVTLEFLVIATVFIVSLFTFSLIIHEAVLEKEDVFDNKVIHFFATHASPGFIAVMEWITFFGSTMFLLPAYIVLIAWLIFKKQKQYAVDVAVIAISSTAMMFAVKQFFHRQRPRLPIIKAIGGYSFPSGHSLSSFIFCTILIYLVWKSSLSATVKYLLIFVLSLCPIAIGLSRIVLNVHFATDVIGGISLAIVWVILSFLILKKIRRNNPAANIDTVS